MQLCIYYTITYFKFIFKIDSGGWVDEFKFFDFSSPFCFLLMGFHCTFSISYKILPYYVYYYCILIRL